MKPGKFGGVVIKSQNTPVIYRCIKRETAFTVAAVFNKIAIRIINCFQII